MDADFNPPINITPMSPQEARECINAIKGNLESLRLMLLELHRRRGWEALLYSSWEDCALAEFGKSRAYTFRLLAAAQVEENLASSCESTNVDLENIPVSHLSKLAKLPPEQQALGLLKAEQIAKAKGEKRNATHVAQAVQELKPSKKQKQTKTQPLFADSARSTDQPTFDQPELPTTATNLTVEQELEQKAKELGLPNCRHQVLPDFERNHSSLRDVDDHPKAAPLSIGAAVNQQPKLKLMLSEAVEACLGEFSIPESLDEPLQGNVYIYPRNAFEKWVSKLLKSYFDGTVKEAIALFPLDHRIFVRFADYALCPLADGLVTVYLGRRVDNFVLCFEDLGTVWHRYGWRP